MFTGIIRHQTAVIHLESGTLHLAAVSTSSPQIGDSIAINGCCLTLTQISSEIWSFHTVPETLKRTNLGNLQPKEIVNLEFPLSLGATLDGHLVQGHIDSVCTIQEKRSLEDHSFWLTFDLPPFLAPYVIEKGSIAVDGISLTVAEVTPTTFSIALIPHTGSCTTLGSKQKGAAVNLEVDLMAKYAEKLLKPYQEKVLL